METILLWALLALNAATLALVIWLLLSRRRESSSDEAAGELRQQLIQEQRQQRQELVQSVQGTVGSLGEALGQNLSYSAQLQAQQYDTLQRTLAAQFQQIEGRLRTSALETEQKLEAVRLTVERRLSILQEDNKAQLDKMRQVVDEKLQRTLEERLTRSFSSVSERLEQVYRGLGEMSALAQGVGDLKKVLSNVKTRGILGEVQLGAILEEILSPEQYGRDVAVTPGSRNVVEFAVRLPAEEGGQVWLPIDSKFPGERYAALRDAADSGDAQQVAASRAALQAALRSEAKDIRDKYIDPPNTTEFAILFLPFEGLYAEAVEHGMIEALQREYHVNVAGPSTMAALLNSLQMGFRAFALQKRSAQVWKTLSAVKTEFGRFSDVLRLTQQRLEQAHAELDKLVGVRTRQIQRTLKEIEEAPQPEAAQLLDQAPAAPADDGPGAGI